MPYHKLKYRPEIQKRIMELRVAGMGLRTIRDRIEEEFGLNLSHTAIADAVKKISFTSQMAIQANAELTEKIEKDILDTTKQIKDINNMMWELINQVKEQIDSKKESGEDLTKDQFHLGVLLDRLINQLRISNQLLGTFHSAPVGDMKVQNMTVNVVNMALAIKSELGRLEKLGMIKILDENMKK